MPSDAVCTCRRSAGERKMCGLPPDKPPCCCADRCTCPQCHFPPHLCDRSPSLGHGGYHRRHSPFLHHPHGHLRRSPFQHHRSDGGEGKSRHGDCGRKAKVKEQQEAGEDHHRGGLHSARRCPSCLPEQVELGEADLLTRQQRCGEARLTEQRRRAALDGFASPRRGGHHPCYTSNTAELLRRQTNASLNAAVDAEYDARRRELQAELDARRGEIAAMQRAREDRRMEAAFDASRRWGGRGEMHHSSPHHCRSTDGARPSTLPRHDKDSSGFSLPPQSPPPPEPPQVKEGPPLSPQGDADAAHHHHGSHSRGDRTPPPLRHRYGWDWERGPRGPRPRDGHRPPSPREPWGQSLGCCPPPPPPWACECHVPSSWQYSKRSPQHSPFPEHYYLPPHSGPCGGRCCHDEDHHPPSPWSRQECPPPPLPPPHHHADPHRCPMSPHEGKKCPSLPLPQPQPRACSPHHSPKSAGTAAAAASACPFCGHPLMSARDIVSMIAAGKLDSSFACPSCGFVSCTLRCPAHCRTQSPHGRCDGSGGRGRGRTRHGFPCGGGRWPRSHSTGSSASSAAYLTGPKFGHKVYITDDLYRDRRARYLAEWEARGAVRRVTPTQRSPSAPLPERTPKWLTTGSECCTD